MHTVLNSWQVFMLAQVTVCIATFALFPVRAIRWVYNVLKCALLDGVCLALILAFINLWLILIIAHVTSYTYYSLPYAMWLIYFS